MKLWMLKGHLPHFSKLTLDCGFQKLTELVTGFEPSVYF